MTNQQINERIALLCGWVAKEHEGLWHLANGKQNLGFNSGLSEEHAWRVICPDYCESLDACREFEIKYTFEEQETVLDILCDKFGMHDAIFKATPLQRCEAFLRMKGKWDEK